MPENADSQEKKRGGEEPKASLALFFCLNGMSPPVLRFFFG
jgi:hypothetical protein